ncbi:hypothetical protein [Breznakiella homolactica]|uniref:Uncharacterized protein n=1 Tax=Breznakiella homolactica TaxID=2798577 RepID=A0A7T7XPP5_9SPIR|nr:hypothetical protein [Breznakiella homolactica]QQO10215.1 hypothetical protein JFL75_04645 [Breznakiella homolactica]
MIQWMEGVSKKIYDAALQFSDNVETVEMKSGKIKRYLKNSAARRIYSVKLDLANDNTPECEYNRFMDWYEKYLRYGTETFYFNKLNSHGYAEYTITRLTSDGQNPKTVTMEWEEQ